MVSFPFPYLHVFILVRKFMPNAETWHFLVQRITHPYEKIIIKFTSLSMLSNHRQLNGLGR